MNSARFPVSVKGVLFDRDERVVLLENDRGEWELPGGRLEEGESLRGCVEREVCEETGAEVEAGPLLGAEVFEVIEGRWVVIVTYGCVVGEDLEDEDLEVSGLRISDEHRRVGLFEVEGLEEIPLPEVYARAVREWSGKSRPDARADAGADATASGTYNPPDRRADGA